MRTHSSTESLNECCRSAGFFTGTSSWDSTHLTAFRIVYEPEQSIKAVLPFYNPSTLHSDGLDAVEKALTPTAIPDGKIEQFPGHQLASLGESMGHFYQLLAKVLEKKSILAKPEREQPSRKAKHSAHQRNVSIESWDSIAASRDSGGWLCK